MKNRAKAAFSWAIALLLSIFAIGPALAYPIEEYAYDAATFHVYRGVIFSAVRAEGWLFPRWVQAINAGLGEPLFSFYPPLVYSLMDILYQLGIAHPVTWRLLVVCALFAASVGTFGLALALFRRADIALACAAIGTYTPYLLQDLFGRGAPQGLAVALYPLLLWLLYRLAEKPSGLRLVWVSIAWAVIILLHNMSALLLLPVIALFFILIAARLGVRSLPACLLALFLGSLLTLFYVLPVYAERHNVHIENYAKFDYARPAANPALLRDLLAVCPVFDIGIGNNSAGTTVGLINILALVLGPLLGILLWRRRQIAAALLVIGLSIAGLVVVWLQTGAATPVWAALPALDIVLFRWRLLAVVGLLATIVVGYLLEQWPQRLQGALAAGLIAVTIGLQIPSLYPQLLFHYNTFSPSPTVAEANDFALQLGLADLSSFGEFSPRWRTLPFTKEEAQKVASSPIANLPTGVQILMAGRRTGWLQATVQTPGPFRAAFHTLYYPGWVGYVDGVRRILQPMQATGYALIDVPAGIHTLTLRYEGTPIQHLGDWLSVGIAALLLLLAFVWKGAKGKLAADFTYLQPRWWLPAAILLLAGLKTGWIDPHTTWLRGSSTPGSVQAAQAQVDVLFGDKVHLAGYTISPMRVHTGDLLRITLYWRVDEPVQEQYDSFVHLLGRFPCPQTGTPVWAQKDRQAPAGHSLSLWVPGKLYRDTYDLPVPAQAPPGEYQLEIGLWQPATGERLMPRIAHPPALQGSPDGGEPLSATQAGSLLVPGIAVHWSAWQPFAQRIGQMLHPVAIRNPRQERLGEKIRLLGYDMEPAAPKPGQTLRVTLYWQALGPIQDSYTVFTHLLDDRGEGRAGHDGIPVGGTRLTAGWVPNEILADIHEITIPAAARPGAYRVEVGLYDATTGGRLPVFDPAGARLEQDRILLDAFTIE